MTTAITWIRGELKIEDWWLPLHFVHYIDLIRPPIDITGHTI